MQINISYPAYASSAFNTSQTMGPMVVRVGNGQQPLSTRFEKLAETAE